MKNLETAIKAYEAEYSRFPASSGAESAATTAGGDFTYGVPPAIQTAGYPMSNSELMQILTDIDGGPGSPNEGHKRNPRRHQFFNAKQVAGGPGLSTVDHVLRDPWGNPYIITMDLNGDDKCIDAFYMTVPNSSQSYQDQLKSAGLAVDRSFTGSVMIWSFGPDGQANPALGAKEGVNKDNVLGWQ